MSGHAEVVAVGDAREGDAVLTCPLDVVENRQQLGEYAADRDVTRGLAVAIDALAVVGVFSGDALQVSKTLCCQITFCLLEERKVGICQRGFYIGVFKGSVFSRSVISRVFSKAGVLANLTGVPCGGAPVQGLLYWVLVLVGHAYLASFSDDPSASSSSTTSASTMTLTSL